MKQRVSKQSYKKKVSVSSTYPELGEPHKQMHKANAVETISYPELGEWLRHYNMKSVSALRKFLRPLFTQNLLLYGPDKSVYERLERGLARFTASGDSESPYRTPHQDVENMIKVIDVFNKLWLHFSVHGLLDHEDRILCFLKSMSHWRRDLLSIGGWSVWMKYFKYRLHAYFFTWMGQSPLDAEVCPFPTLKMKMTSLLVSRKLDRVMWITLKKAKLTNLDEDTTRLRNTQLHQQITNLQECVSGVLYLKKALYRPDDAMVEKGVQDTVRDLTQEPEEVPSVDYEIHIGAGELDLVNDDFIEQPKVRVRIDRHYLKSQIRRTVREIFRGKQFTMADALHLRAPSLKANLHDSIRDGGTWARLCADPEVKGAFNRIVMCGKSYTENFDMHAADFVEKLGFGIDERSLQEFCAWLFSYTLELASSGLNIVKPLGLKEAMKVRVITKEPPYLMFLLKPFQRWMWKIVDSHPVFSLLGQPVPTPEFLEGLWEPEGDEGYLSGDYTAATNKLQSWASDEVAETLKEFMDPALVRLGYFDCFKKSLTGHWFMNFFGTINPWTLECELESDGLPYPDLPHGLLPQRNGQLMGSITSFPVLCIVNAALCRAVVELDQIRDGTEGAPSYALKDSGIRVNGDDCVLVTTRHGVELWKFAGAIMGLSPSPGKFYWCKHYVNINSYAFYSDRHTEEVWEDVESVLPTFHLSSVRFRLARYCNWAIVFGSKRSESKEERDLHAVLPEVERGQPYGTIGQLSNEIFDMFPVQCRRAAFRVFLEYRVKPCFKSYPHIPWFVPEVFGGLGLCQYFSDHWIHKKEDLRRACLIWNNSSLLSSMQCLRSAALFPHWQLLLKKFRSFGILTDCAVPETDGTFDSITEEGKGDILNFSYCLLPKPVPMDLSTHRTMMHKVLKNNNRLWEAADRRGARRGWPGGRKFRNFSLSACSLSHDKLHLYPLRGRPQELCYEPILGGTFLDAYERSNPGYVALEEIPLTMLT